MDLHDIAEGRSWGVRQHSFWKAQMRIMDEIQANRWEVIWDDETVEPAPPLVENAYLTAVEDKTMAAAQSLPSLIVWPTQGTQKDKSEANAERRRRVMSSYWTRSNLRREAFTLYGDWHHSGVMYAMPWADGLWTPDMDSFPYFLIVDPRGVYPLGHRSNGDLSSALIVRKRLYRDVEAEWGVDHPGLKELKARRTKMGLEAKLEMVEELWVMDDTGWGVAFCDTSLPRDKYSPRSSGFGPMTSEGWPVAWALPWEDHGLPRCPLVEAKRKTLDGEYRGVVWDIVPTLQVAHNLMAKLLEDVDANIFAPTLLDNIVNPDEYGPNGILIGTGDRPANILRDRPPVNFEAQQVIGGLLDQARRQAMEPEQRSGVFGASIASQKAVNAVMGSWNAELAQAQIDFEHFLGQLTSLTAAFDENYTPGKKKVDGYDSQGGAYSLTYDPVTLYKGDWRCHVTYGERTGLDENNHVTRLAMVRNMGGMAKRTFMTKSGVIQDPLQEEREIGLELILDQFNMQVLPGLIQSGQFDILQDFIANIDSDRMTYREAVLAAMKKLYAPTDPAAAEGAVPGAAAPGAGGPADLIEMMRSAEAGGIPGNAEGFPLAPDLAGMLPPPTERMASELAPM